jgi:phage-related protein
VNFSLRGLSYFRQGMEEVKGTLEQVQKGVQAVGEYSKWAFAGAALSAYAFVKSGLAASNVGVLLNFQMERLARSVGGLFGPEIRKVIDLLSQLTGWIERLTPHQKDMAARFAQGAVAALAVATVLPLVLSSVISLTGALYNLAASGIVVGITFGGTILPVIGALAAAFTAFAIGTEVGRGAIGRLWAAIGPLVSQATALAGTLMTALTPLAEFAVYLFETVAKVVVAALGPLQEVAQVVGTALKGAFDQIAPLIEGFADVWAELVGAVVAFLPPLFKMAAALLNLIVPVAALIMKFELFVTTIGVKVIGAVLWLAGAILNFLAPALQLVGDLAGSFGRILAAVGGHIVNFASWAGGLIYGALKPLLDWVYLVAFAIESALVSAFKEVAKWIREAALWLEKFFGVKAPELKKIPFEKAKDPNREQLPMRSGGFEAIEATYRRIAEASVKVGIGKSIEEQQLEEQKGIRRAIDLTTDAVRGNKVPIR